MFKPMEGTRYASLSGLYDLIGPNIETILIVIDQEDESTEDVFGGIEKQLRNYGYRHERETDGKIAVYACEKGGKQLVCV